MTDIAIVGKGPAGWSCAMTARMRGLSATVIAPANDAGLLRAAERIDNYPGMPHASGESMLESFRSQALELGAEERAGLVRQIMPTESGFMLLVENDVMEAKTVLLAMGAARPVLLPGEEEQLGRGVSYCATCDGMLYRGKRTAVIGLSADAPEEAEFLRSIGCDVRYFEGKKQKFEIRGKQTADTLVVDGEEIPVDAVFVLRSGVAAEALLPGLATDGGHVVVDAAQATNIPGVFAAGDCTGAPYQLPVAVGEGNKAALSAVKYLR